MLTDEDIKRIGSEFTKRMIDNRIMENRRRRRNKQRLLARTATARCDFQDGNGDLYDLNDYSKEAPAIIDMSDDNYGYFYLIFDQHNVPHWISEQSHMRTVEEMAEFLDENLWGEFTIIQL